MSGGIHRAACRFAVGLLLATLVAPASAERHGVEDVRFRRYGIDSGLSQLTVRSMAQDRTGFVWLGTQDGLNRFDGYSFRVFRRTADAGAVSDNYVVSLAADPDGSVWVGTQVGGLSHFDPATETFANTRAVSGDPDALADNNISALLVDKSAKVWVGTGAGTVHLLSSRDQPLRFRALALGTEREPGIVRALHERRDGSVLIGARNGMWLCTAAGRCGVEWRYRPGQRLDVHDVLEAPDGSIWVGTSDRGLYRFDADGKPVAALREGEGGGEGLVSDDIRTLLVDAQERLWIGTNEGLSRLDLRSGKLRSWTNDPAVADSIASNRVYSLLEDRDGLVWAGTWLNGVSVFDPRTEAFVLVRPASGEPGAIPTPVVRSLFVDADGTLWFALLESGGLVHFDLERGVLRRYVNDPDDPSSLSNDNVQFVTRTRDGALWAGTFKGLNRLRADGEGFDRFVHDDDDPGSLGGDGVLHVYLDTRDTLWVSTDGAGLDERCAGCTAFRHHRPDPANPHAIAGTVVNSVFESSKGELWVALRPGGLDRMDRGNGRFEHFRSDPNRPGSLSSDSVTVLTEDRAGRIWVGTQGGGVNLMLRDEKTGEIGFRAYTRSQGGLGADAVGGVIEDAGGRLWISTTAGISRFDPESGEIENFTQRTGIQVAGYFVNAAGVASDGRVVFGGLRGATIVDPARLPEPRPVQRTAITGVRALRKDPDPRVRLDVGTGTNGPERVRVPYQLGDFSIEFASLSFVDPLSLGYDYRLDSFDEDWIQTDAQHRIATYTNLPPGEYLFRVRARQNGARVGEESQLAITLAAPPWATRWAQAGYAAFGLGLLAFIAWQTHQRVQERRRSATRVAQSEERLKLALWGTGDELWDVELPTGRLFRMNPLLHLKVTQESAEQSLKGYAPFVHPEDRSVFNEEMVAHVKGDSEFFEATYRSLGVDGTWRWLRSRGRCVARDAAGNAIRIVGTTEDITEVKEHEQALERVNQALEERVRDRTADLTIVNDNLKMTIEQLRQAQRQLVESEKMAALGGLVAGVAHEINTPLGVGVTAASHLESEARRMSSLASHEGLKRSDFEAFQKVARDSTQLILRNLQRADKLVKSFKQVAVDQSSEQKRNIVLRSYIDEILTSLHPALKKTRHVVTVECPESLAFETYPGAIYQIIVNLVMNSIVHGFEGADAGTIRIVAGAENGIVTLVYSDNGRGMSDDVRRRVFEPFFTTRRGQGGSGLGMHIAYNLTTQVLRGTLTCESALGQGVKFTVMFPIDAGGVAKSA